MRSGLIGRTLYRLTGLPEPVDHEEARRALAGLLDEMAAKAAGVGAPLPAPPVAGRVRALLEPAWLRRPS